MTQPDSLMTAPYPTANPTLIDIEAEEWGEMLIDNVTVIRKLKKEVGYTPKDVPDVYMRITDNRVYTMIDHIEYLCKVRVHIL